MSVLITTPDLEKPGGVAHYYASLRAQLASDVKYTTVGSRAACREHDGVLVRSLKDCWYFYRQLKRHGARLVHLNPSLGHKALLRDGVLLLVAKLLGRRVVVFLRGWDCDCEGAIRRRYLFLFRLVYFRADAFIVLATRFKSVLRDFGCDKPIYVETTVVADDVFSRAEAESTRRKPEPGHLNILFLSRVEKAKGIYEAIHAFRMMKDRYPRLTMTVAGGGSELQKAMEYVNTEGIADVRFLGWVYGEEKHKAFAGADIYLFPTHGEGMPNSVLEAMAYGIPIVTRPVGGVADFFEDGAMGYVTKSMEPQVFAQHLETLIRSRELRDRMSRYNRQYAWDHFRASAVAERLRHIYEEVLLGRSDESTR
jgi:glycosyltransferase involved in cell wall biosynthesis